MSEYYYTFDHNGNTRELLDGSGNIVTRYNYDPYGRTTTTHLSGSIDATFQYAGLMPHLASGLYLSSLGNTYDPTQGRWIGRDRLGEGSSLNLYSYVGNNPVTWIDALGLARYEYDGQGLHVHDNGLTYLVNPTTVWSFCLS